VPSSQFAGLKAQQNARWAGQGQRAQDSGYQSLSHLQLALSIVRAYDSTHAN
jgi:hypothetical protein